MASKATLKKMASMFNGDLPIIKATVMTGYDREQDKYIYSEKDVEVLSINFNTGSIRVRYLANPFSEEDVIQCYDIGDSEYLEKVLKTVKGLK